MGAGGAPIGEPPEKKQKQAASLRDIVSKAISRSGAAARLWLTSRAINRVIQNLDLANQHPFVPLGGTILAAFLQPVLEAIPDAVGGATVTNTATQSLAQVSNAPTQQDITSAPAPQLSTTEDPVGITDPAIPESEFMVLESSLENHFTDFAESETVLSHIQAAASEEGSEISPEEAAEVVAFLRASHSFVPSGTSQGKLLGDVSVKQDRKWVGKFVPV